MNLWMLALRNLLRNRRRSLATLLAMVVGLTAILLFGGYRSNILYGMETGFVQFSGHLQVQRRGYFADGGDNPSAYGIAGYQRIMDAIASDPELAPLLRVVTPTLQLGGIAGHMESGHTRSVLANGLVAQEYNRLMQWNDYRMVSYAQPLALEGTAANAAVIGTGVARKLQLCAALQVPSCENAGSPALHQTADATAVPDDVAALSAMERSTPSEPSAQRIEMLVATARGAPNVASLQAIKAVNLGVKAIDDLYLAMHLPQAQRLLYGTQAPEVTSIVVQLHHTAQLPAARARLEALLGQQFAAQALEVLDFRTLNPMFGQTDEFMASMFGFIALLIAVIVLFTIANTMGTAVVERTVEIGTLRAMGQRCSGIRRLFLCEALLLGAAGTVLGLLATAVLAWAINHSGWTWTPPGYAYAYLVLVRVWQDLPLLAGSIVGLLAITLASAWWPARRAARMDIVDALRHA
ncbi:ABC transporter permease [Acidovorax sp. HDW3]|uniref:ABC transporter permease n=1 Tax=Acidovorax sp. HDW3 TaxID=2714923 RepID=UPI00140E4C58|nr:FtsX-like permease family protein [Acidovorax sp. HDW3]QIL44033.1 ABC transporter permease [Acidovorax sp. HDW3]